ncbi:response regulator [Streptomyces sp. NPDC004111]|uniref:response regulator n=1 Tax=Streptomyces sp. NPDC004111 TaxID=3364690 RepID=UPI0036C19631
MPIRVLIADAEEVVRIGLRAILAHGTEFEIVADTGDGPEAVERARTDRPDVCVMGTHLEGMSGLEAVRELAGSPCRIVVLTASTSDDDFCAAMRCGAHAFLAKSLEPAVLRQSIRLAASGAYALSPSAADSLRGLLHGCRHLPDEGCRHLPVHPIHPLSPSELQVAALVAAGRTDREIADRRGVSASAVKKTVSQCRRKVLAKNRVELARWAWLSGLDVADGQEGGPSCAPPRTTAGAAPT